MGLPTFQLEVDAKYIKGMLNNPDMQPNNAINWWIAGILLFNFELVHVPGKSHMGPDGHSRHRVSFHFFVLHTVRRFVFCFHLEV